jgi:hypothetical protein
MSIEKNPMTSSGLEPVNKNNNNNAIILMYGNIKISLVMLY